MIRGFSPASRRRLLATVNSIDQVEARAEWFAFVTLTYPAAFPTASASKRDLDTFIKRLERAWGRRGLLWKLEPQQRGAPHFHLLLYMGGAFDSTALCVWVADAWHDIAGGGDRHHHRWHLGMLGNRPCVEVVKDWQGVANYAGKYLGKVSLGDEEWSHPGRFWGIRHRELLPIRMSKESLEQREAVHLRRGCIRLHESQPDGWYYIPGKRLSDGRHLPGQRVSGRQKFEIGGREIELRHCLDVLSRWLEVEIRPQRRRWRAKRGGWSGFMPSATFDRMLTWAKYQAWVDTAPGVEASGEQRGRAAD